MSTEWREGGIESREGFKGAEEGMRGGGYGRDRGEGRERRERE